MEQNVPNAASAQQQQSQSRVRTGLHTALGPLLRGRQVTVSGLLVLIALIWLVDAISVGALFDVFLADVARRQSYKHPNEFVGLVESVRGLTSLLAAGPIGYMSDRMDRLVFLRLIVLTFGAVAVILISVSILSEKLSLVLVGVAFHAVLFQASASICDAILADLVGPGASRTSTYTKARAVSTFARSMGPGLQAVLLTCFGAEFAGPALGKVLVCGYFGLLVFAALLWPLRMPTANAGQCEVSAAGNSLLAGSSSSSQAEPEVLARMYGVPLHLLVPGLITAFNLTFMIGGGITLKFFPLFYHDTYGLTEESVCWVMALYWLMTAGGAQMTVLWSRCPRPVAVLILHIIGSLMLFGFIAAQDLWLNLAIFETRPLAINSHFALNTALMMDFALPAHRGKWAAVGSLNRATWAGSAAIGGFLTDAYGYRPSFTITGCIFFLAAAVYSPILCVTLK